MKIFVWIVLLSMGVTSAYSSDVGLAGKEFDRLPKSVKKLFLLNRSIIDKGGEGVKAISFKDTNYRYSLTGIVYKNKKNPDLHMALVSSRRSGASVGFKIRTKCQVAVVQDKVVDRVVRVDDVNVSAGMLCLGNSAQDGGTEEVYILTTQAGKEYVKKQFLQNQYVFVDFGEGEVPFATEGFEGAWGRANEPAL